MVGDFNFDDNYQDWENRHKVTRDWRDSEKYFLQNKFRQWLHSIVQKTLNELGGQVTVNGVTYLIQYKMSGPAYTLNIHNGDEHFQLDVDLVPVIRFLLPRWPEGYRYFILVTSHYWIKDISIIVGSMLIDADRPAPQWHKNVHHLKSIKNCINVITWFSLLLINYLDRPKNSAFLLQVE